MAVADLTHLQVRHLSEKATEAARRIERNRVAVSALFDYTALPYAAPPAYRPGHVCITVPTLADLNRWLLELRGQGVQTVTDRPFHGFEMWVLHTHTPPGRDGYRAPLRVAATVPEGSPVPFELGDIEAAS